MPLNETLNGVLCAWKPTLYLNPGTFFFLPSDGVGQRIKSAMKQNILFVAKLLKCSAAAF